MRVDHPPRTELPHILCASCQDTGSDRSSGEPCINCPAGQLARNVIYQEDPVCLKPETPPETVRSVLQMLVEAETELEEITEYAHGADEMRVHANAAIEQVRAAQLRLTPFIQGDVRVV